MADDDASKTIGFVFIEGFAEWEHGLLAASAVEWFGARTVALTPKAAPVRSIGGFLLMGERPISADAAEDCDALVVVGSGSWRDPRAPDLSSLLRTAAAAGKVVAGICAGTLPLARAGLFAGRAHTSNGKDWLRQQLGYYPGDSRYRDVPHAVIDGPIVSAPGTAPGTFALGVLSALYPDSSDLLSDLRRTFAGEYAEARSERRGAWPPAEAQRRVAL